MSKALEDIAAERQRQINSEGWTHEHDDAHVYGSLAMAAAAYAASASSHPQWAKRTFPLEWDQNWFKPTNQRRDLVKAGALILAEIERIDRAAKSGAA